MIKSSEDLNNYYNLVNQYIDEYVDNWKIKPNNLKNYLLGNKSRLVKFLEKRGLKDVNNINRVLIDVIEDRIALFNDGVLTFENFNLFESKEFKIVEIRQCLYKGVGKATIQHEKLLADEYDVSLSEIDVISSDRRHFKVYDNEVIVYTKEDISIIEENIKNFLYDKIEKSSINIQLSNLNEIKIESFIDTDKLKTYIENAFKTNEILKIIKELINPRFSILIED
jgi:hypothetical protein